MVHQINTVYRRTTYRLPHVSIFYGRPERGTCEKSESNAAQITPLMKTEAIIFPSIEINLLADVNTFVSTWISLYPTDNDYDFYFEYRFKRKLNEKQLLRLFEWYNKGPLDEQQMVKFAESVAPHLPLINRARKKADWVTIYTDSFFVNPLWHGFIAHLVGGINGPPFFDEDIYRAYHYMHTVEIRELPDDRDEQSLQHGLYTDFYFNKEKVNRYHHSNEMWDLAMRAFGRFLKHHPDLFLKNGMYVTPG